MLLEYGPSRDTELLGAGSSANEEVIDIPVGQFGRVIIGFQDPNKDIEGAPRTQGTQDFTTRTPFLKVRVYLPPYFIPLPCSDSSNGSKYGSSDQEWLGILERDESKYDKNVSIDEGDNGEVEDQDTFCDESKDQTQEGWCQDGSLFRQFQSKADS